MSLLSNSGVKSGRLHETKTLVPGTTSSSRFTTIARVYSRSSARSRSDNSVGMDTKTNVAFYPWSHVYTEAHTFNAGAMSTKTYHLQPVLPPLPQTAVAEHDQGPSCHRATMVTFSGAIAHQRDDCITSQEPMGTGSRLTCLLDYSNDQLLYHAVCVCERERASER